MKYQEVFVKLVKILKMNDSKVFIVKNKRVYGEV